MQHSKGGAFYMKLIRTGKIPLLLTAVLLAGSLIAANAEPAPQASAQQPEPVLMQADIPAPVRHIAGTPVPLPDAAEASPAAVPETEEPLTDTQQSTVPENLELLDTFLATAYCVTGTTATGTYTTVNRTLAVNPGVIPYGTHVWLFLDDGTLVGDYYAEDTGSNMMVHPHVIDIYMGPDYDTCMEWGVKHVSVYIEKPVES